MRSACQPSCMASVSAGSAATRANISASTHGGNPSMSVRIGIEPAATHAAWSSASAIASAAASPRSSTSAASALVGLASDLGQLHHRQHHLVVSISDATGEAPSAGPQVRTDLENIRRHRLPSASASLSNRAQREAAQRSGNICRRRSEPSERRRNVAENAPPNGLTTTTGLLADCRSILLWNPCSVFWTSVLPPSWPCLASAAETFLGSGGRQRLRSRMSPIMRPPVYSRSDQATPHGDRRERRHSVPTRASRSGRTSVDKVPKGLEATPASSAVSRRERTRAGECSRASECSSDI